MRIGNITFDCADPARVAAFWSAVLGYGEPGGDRDEGNTWAHCQPREGSGPNLYFQRVPEPKVVKNRVHLDVAAFTGLDAAVAQLEQLGARRGQRFDEGGSTWFTMFDPEGNEFCVSAAS